MKHPGTPSRTRRGSLFVRSATKGGLVRRTGVRQPRPNARECPITHGLPSPLAHLLRNGAPYFMRTRAKRVTYEVCKRMLDIVAALVLLVLTLPLCMAVAILIKATSPGPTFFRHKRLGRGGKEFWCLKFRTMVVDAEEQLRRCPRLREQFEANYKIKNDPRVTPVGRFLRRTSIDELPQLLQVLTGQMSLIGPRPIVLPELERYGIHQQKLLSVRPGLSGLWQASGRSNITYERRVQIDVQYIDYRGLRLDLMLILLTAASVLAKRGSC